MECIAICQSTVHLWHIIFVVCLGKDSLHAVYEIHGVKYSVYEIRGVKYLSSVSEPMIKTTNKYSATKLLALRYTYLCIFMVYV